MKFSHQISSQCKDIGRPRLEQSRLFISFEGVESSGKSTQAKLLADWFSHFSSEAIHTREPGGTILGEKIRNLLLQPEDMTTSPLAESLLFAAARAQLVHEVIAPVLQRGGVVIADRYIDSSLAYQGYGLGVPLATLWAINEAALAQAMPDITFLLGHGEDLVSCLERPPSDHIESRDEAFHNRVRQGFLDLSHRYPERIVVVDTSEGIEHTSQMIRQHIHRCFMVGC